MHDTSVISTANSTQIKLSCGNTYTFSVVSHVEFAMENASLLKKKLFALHENHRSNIDAIISKYEKQGEFELNNVDSVVKLKDFVIPINTKEDINLIKKLTANKKTCPKPKIYKTRIVSVKQATVHQSTRRSIRQIKKKEKKGVNSNKNKRITIKSYSNICCKTKVDFADCHYNLFEYFQNVCRNKKAYTKE